MLPQLVEPVRDQSVNKKESFFPTKGIDKLLSNTQANSQTQIPTLKLLPIDYEEDMKS